MGDFISSIGQAISSLLQFLLNAISGLFQMIKMLPSALNLTSYVFTFLPSVLATFVVAMISISVVYLIIDR